MSSDTDILVVGAGPTGLALALQAHDHGALVRVVERRTEAFRPSRAFIMHARTLEALRPLGVTATLLARANVAPEVRLRLGARVVRARLGDFALPDTAFPHLTLVRQADVETALVQALEERGIAVERGVEMAQLDEGADEVRATLRSAAGVEQTACRFLIGCDGPASGVRARAGIGWRGGPYDEEAVLADVELDAPLAPGVAHGAVWRRGLLIVLPLGERATWRLVATRPGGSSPSAFGQPGPPLPVAELQALLDGAGFTARIATLAWSARYTLQHRLAAQFRRGPLFLAGDAAHAYSPATGQGMNAGIQDALNLGWKLAFSAASSQPDALLDSYDRERRPVARHMLALTHLAFWAEASTGPLPGLLRGLLAPLAAPAAPALLGNRRLVALGVRLLAQFWVAYPDSPLSVEGNPRLTVGVGVGHRLPDATVVADGRRARLHELLARPGVHVLLHRDAIQLEFGPPYPRVTVHRLTSVPGAGLVAVRPDGYVGFRCATADRAQLGAWLARVGAPARA
jgi:2-polyprenyl-6-methoxyphenol hydroxylase-like FAD-dependent oxidoreductase